MDPTLAVHIVTSLITLFVVLTCWHDSFCRQSRMDLKLDNAIADLKTLSLLARTIDHRTRRIDGRAGDAAGPIVAGGEDESAGDDARMNAPMRNDTMKLASQLIAELQAAIDEHGDHRVLALDGDEGLGDAVVEFEPKVYDDDDDDYCGPAIVVSGEV